MNNIAFSGGCRSFEFRECSCQLDSATNMTHLVIADRDIGYSALGAFVRLVHRCKENRKTCLREASPNVLQHIPFEENALRVLQFKMVFYDERITIGTANKTRLIWFPVHRLEQMIVSDFYIGGSGSSWITSEEDVFTGSLQEVVNNLIWATRCISSTTIYRLRICARTCPGDTVEITEIRVNYCHVAGSAEVQPALGLILCSPVHPNAIEYKVVRGRLFGRLR